MKVLKGNFLTAPQAGQLHQQENAYLVLSDDGTIVGLYPTLPSQYAQGELLDFGDCLILQSFVDMHLHAPQYPLFGMGMDLPLLQWLDTYAFPTEAHFSDPAFARTAYHQLAKDLIDNGTTRVCMFSSLHTEATLILMDELEKAGVTGYVGKVNMDRNSSPQLQESTQDSIRETLRFLEESQNFHLVKPILTPRFTPSCSDTLMAALGKLANERGLYVQSHLSENLAEMQWVRELHPDCQQYWQTYEKFGLWKGHTVMAHCVHCDEAEQAAIVKNNVVVAHCPDSNINLCSGAAPIRQMMDAGIWVTLGSDIAGGSTLSMLQVMAGAIRTSKAKHMALGDACSFLTAREVYYLATTAGHRYFGAGNGFCPGEKLHAVVLDDRHQFSGIPRTLEERLERAIYRATPENICAVWSEGRKVK